MYSSSQRDIETFKNKVINSTKCNVKDNYVRPKRMSIGFGKIAVNGVLFKVFFFSTMVGAGDRGNEGLLRGDGK